MSYPSRALLQPPSYTGYYALHDALGCSPPSRRRRGLSAPHISSQAARPRFLTFGISVSKLLHRISTFLVQKESQQRLGQQLLGWAGRTTIARPKGPALRSSRKSDEGEAGRCGEEGPRGNCREGFPTLGAPARGLHIARGLREEERRARAAKGGCREGAGRAGRGWGGCQDRRRFR